MFRKFVIAGVIAVATIAIPAASQAAGFAFGISGPNGSISINSNGAIAVTDHHRGPGRWDGHRPRHDRLGEWQVRRIVRSAGFYEARVVDENRFTYTVRAVTDRGRDRVITVHAYSGEILSVERLRRR